jgi:signal transduction histidine kinase
VTAGSLKFRLLAAAAFSIVLALTAAGWALVKIFERHVDRRVVVELQEHLNFLAANLEVVETALPSVVRQPTAPRFDAPLGGLYWQVWSDGAAIDGSQSLVGAELAVAAGVPRSIEPRRLLLSGPAEAPIIALVRDVIVSGSSGSHDVRILVAAHESDVAHAVGAFQRELAGSLFVLGNALLLAAWLQVAVGLQPLQSLRQRLLRVRTGEDRRLAGKFPNEVRPLIDDLNGLLQAQEESIGRARARAGNLAHGLKTPLTALNSVVRDLDQQGQSGPARDVAELVGSMRNHVERELAKARVAGANVARRTLLTPLANQLVGTLKRTPDGARVAWELDIPAGFSVTIDSDDLAELMGNLLENAQKWGRSRVRLKASGTAMVREMTVEDDGPGVPDEMLTTILGRGIKLDERRPGSGLGLSIVSDIAEAYGLTLEFYRAAIGGLGVRVVQEIRTAEHAGEAAEPRRSIN